MFFCNKKKERNFSSVVFVYILTLCYTLKFT